MADRAPPSISSSRGQSSAGRSGEIISGSQPPVLADVAAHFAPVQTPAGATRSHKKRYLPLLIRRPKNRIGGLVHVETRDRKAIHGLEVDPDELGDVRPEFGANSTRHESLELVAGIARAIESLQLRTYPADAVVIFDSYE